MQSLELINSGMCNTNSEFDFELRISDSCNLNCSYCMWHCGVHYQYDDIVKCIGFIDEFSFGHYEKINIYLHGGEPTTHKDIIKILQNIKSLNIESTIELQTNLTMDVVLLADIIKYIDYLDVSLHYIELLNTNTKDTFDNNLLFLNKNNYNIHNMDIMLEDVGIDDEYYSYIKSILNMDIITNSEMIYNYYGGLVLDYHQDFYNEYNITETKYRYNNSVVNTNDLYLMDLDFRGWNCKMFVTKMVINGNGDIHYCDTSMTLKSNALTNLIIDKNAMKKVNVLRKTGITCKWRRCVCFDSSRQL